MKFRFFGAVAAALALFASCETLVEQEFSVEFLPTQEQVIFTADLGVDTKTYLEYEDNVYKTRWEQGDRIFILSTSSDSSYAYETVNVLEGAGTSTAKFAASSAMKGEKYFAYYGANANFTSLGEFYPHLQEYQYRPGYYDEAGNVVMENQLEGEYFPMYAESTTTSFTFKNLCAILKVDLVGTDYIENVIFTPNDTSIPVAGKTHLTFTNGTPELQFVNDSTLSHKVCFYVQEILDPTTPVSCYISIPAQTYPGGFTLTINSGNGSMVVKTTENITFERSEIRSVPTITYKNQTENTWGLCGVITNWTEDIAMTYSNGFFILKNQYLEAGVEFKFRANGTWDVNYGYSAQAISPDTAVELTPNGPNMYMTETGYYDITLDANLGVALFVKAASQEDHVVCYSYDEVAALPDDTKVMVQGFVFSPYARGFVMNIGQYWNNTILVYQGTDQSMYTPVMGNLISLIATKVTYNGLPELKNIEALNVDSDQMVDFGYNRYYNLTDPEAFRNFTCDRYEYIKFAGTLEKSGSYYNVRVDGVTERMGSIEYPIQDLTEFIGKKVLVEGWFIGISGGKYVKVVLRSISEADDSGSAEDVTPGDDIVVTTKTSKVIK